MADDLRTLAQAVVDADCSAVPAVQRAYEAATCDLGQALGYPRGADATTSTARAILAALDAAYAQGYARAMDEVVEQLDSLSDAAVATYQEHRTDYADGLADGSVEAWQAVRAMARERLPTAAERD